MLIRFLMIGMLSLSALSVFAYQAFEFVIAWQML
ncbi:hypothetical protein BkAM31D_22130 [Halalkalibacter krulwichiae]|uniref:Uncharacterized protein n=1 Tax=Halalkalibacter krulwichiae TaxID=199441 RepID=A0A1X9MFZ3_9BACI|nr:hypothetical protein BkAM31D_22130 [Halalkalibacter krulwichiae]